LSEGHENVAVLGKGAVLVLGARIRRVTVSAWPPLSTAAGIEIAAYPTFVERMNAAGVQIFLQ